MQDEENKNEDIEFVPEEGEDLRVADPVEKIKGLKEKLKDCQAEKQDYLTNWQIERADFLNYKKDEAARVQRAAAYMREEFTGELLPVLDSYDMAFANKEAWEKVDKNWRIGVEYIHQQLIKVLSDYGVTEISSKEGEAFDPKLHQSMEAIETSEKEKDHSIARHIQKGYKTVDRIIRPARVAVFEYKQK